ncbi:hypothetical protein K7432_013132 [Basidiobolus ranarum]|uniref:5'-nucleotidase n=1 Tax=Basidiobolus ranarum TaxID=34480 RepID=A0ABR2VRV6_9FUNG
MGLKLPLRYSVLCAIILLTVIHVIFRFITSPTHLRRLTIIHTNDIHAHIEQFNQYGKDCDSLDIELGSCVGGIARQKTIIDRIRQNSPNTLLFDAGDQFSGTAYYGYYKGNISHQVMNLLGYDLMTLGNHEFDDGVEQLSHFLSKLNFPTVCANLEIKEQPELSKRIKPYEIFPEYQLGVIGIVTTTTEFTSNSGPNVKFTQPIDMVKKYVQELKSVGVKTIIVLSHNGYREDIELATQTTDIDLIVGGHSHTFLSSNSEDPHHSHAEGDYPTLIKNLDGHPTYITQAWSWGRYVGHLELQLNDEGKIHEINGRPIRIDSSVPEDPEVAIAIQGWRDPLVEYMNRVIGKAILPFSPPTYWVTVESTIGNLVGDAISHVRNTSVGIFFNFGDVQGGLEIGDIQIQDIFRVIPFDSSVVEITLSGRQLFDMIEGVLSHKNLENQEKVTGAIQVNGIRFRYLPNATEFHKLQELFISNGNLSEYNAVQFDQQYTLVTLDFVAKGGDNILYPPIPHTTPLGTLRSILIQYIEAQKTLIPHLDGRITISTDSIE